MVQRATPKTPKQVKARPKDKSLCMNHHSAGELERWSHSDEAEYNTGFKNLAPDGRSLDSICQENSFSDATYSSTGGTKGGIRLEYTVPFQPFQPARVPWGGPGNFELDGGVD